MQWTDRSVGSTWRNHNEVDSCESIWESGAVVLGVVGVLLSATVIGIGWWAGVKTTARLDRATTRVDQGMSKIDVRLAGVESRVNSLRTDLNAVQASVKTITDDNTDLPQVRSEIESAFSIV